MTTPIKLSTPPPATPLTATIAASRLVEQLVLHRSSVRIASQNPTSIEDHDRRLADRLVETGILNRWQVDQLKRGRTKFTLGPYKILDSIARGGMGHVFKAEHDMLGRVEAIKVLPRSKSTPQSVESFRHEIRSQSALDHPNLVRVSFAGQDGETFFLVTEYVAGIDLRRLIRRRGPLDESIAAWVVAQAAGAIDHAHRRGLVHRDVKPGNLLLTPHGGVKVTDLGLAWSLDGAGDNGDPAGENKIAGTSDYLAPEAIRDPGRVWPASDIYGLGCTLYYAVTGKVPFPGGTHLDKLRRRLREEPIEPQLITPGLSQATVTLIRHAMARQPAHRPESAAAMAKSLLALTDDRVAERLALIVNETLARRRPLYETRVGIHGDLDDLPETVCLPLHDVSAPTPAAAAMPATAEAATGATPRRSRLSLPQRVTLVTLALTALIAVSAVLRRFF